MKILCIGKKGFDMIRRQFGERIIEVVEISAKQLTFGVAEPIGAKVLDLFRRGEFDVCTLFFSRFQSVISQVPTGLQLIPLNVPQEAGADAGKAPGSDAVYEYEPDETAILDALLPRNIAVADLPRPSGERRVRAGGADERDGQCHPQCRRHDQEADAAL